MCQDSGVHWSRSHWDKSSRMVVSDSVRNGGIIISSRNSVYHSLQSEEWCAGTDLWLRCNSKRMSSMVRLLPLTTLYLMLGDGTPVSARVGIDKGRCCACEQAPSKQEAYRQRVEAAAQNIAARRSERLAQQFCFGSAEDEMRFAIHLLSY